MSTKQLKIDEKAHQYLKIKSATMGISIKDLINKIVEDMRDDELKKIKKI